MNAFAELGLSQALVDAVTAIGFEQPTDIQTKAIPMLLANDSDLVGLAQTGTGKTAAFGLPLIDLVDTDQKHTQGLILSPTRELCLQIAKELKQFAQNHKSLRISAVYGGADIVKQMKEIKRGAHIVVATPGRLRDLIRRNVAQLNNIHYLVLDEADEMLNMGFKEEIDSILENTSDDKLTWLFSATMPNEVRRIAKNYMSNPQEISVGQRNSSNTDIDHQYVVTLPRERYETLRRFLDSDPSTFGLVFVRTRRDAKEVADRLLADGYSADALHGDMSQSQRDRTMENFRRQRLKVLVATDVAARGIDVNEITHVFHYNIPEDISFYTHRAGRTGRAGNKGISLVLAHPKDIYLIKKLERIIKTKFTLGHIPTGREICEKRLLHQLERLRNTEINSDIDTFAAQIEEKLGDLTKEELIKKVATASFNKFIKMYRQAPDLNPRRKGENGKRTRPRMKRLFINVGSLDVGDVGGFISFVCDNINISSSVLGKITLQNKHTFFDIEEDLAKPAIEAFDGSEYNNRTLRVNEDAQKSNDNRRSGGGGRHKRRNRQDSRRSRFQRSRS
ncbi:MAG: DEAD/DEAH box helicase [Saprospiraceae bacterium]